MTVFHAILSYVCGFRVGDKRAWTLAVLCWLRCLSSHCDGRLCSGSLTQGRVSQLVGLCILSNVCVVFVVFVQHRCLNIVGHTALFGVGSQVCVCLFPRVGIKKHVEGSEFLSQSGTLQEIFGNTRHCMRVSHTCNARGSLSVMSLCSCIAPCSISCHVKREVQSSTRPISCVELAERRGRGTPREGGVPTRWKPSSVLATSPSPAGQCVEISFGE